MRDSRSKWLLALVALWVVVGALVGVAPALAQRSGGSMGGGSFGGGGGSSFSSSGGGGVSLGGGGGGCSCCGMPVGLFAVVLLILHQQRKQKQGGAMSHGAHAWSHVDVSALRLAVDWRARRVLQDRLDALAQRSDTSSKRGLAALLGTTVRALRETEVAWLYANVANYHPMSEAMAEGIFRQLGVDARSKFQDEVVRNVDGTATHREAAAMRARPEEGEGVVVVTLIVAARREILDVGDPRDAGALRSLLDEMAQVANPSSLVAVEIVWSPAEEQDRMSTAELEAHYPQLKKLDEASVVGRVFCDYCRGPYAAELGECPHCGAPGARPS